MQAIGTNHMFGAGRGLSFGSQGTSGDGERDESYVYDRQVGPVGGGQANGCRSVERILCFVRPSIGD